MARAPLVKTPTLTPSGRVVGRPRAEPPKDAAKRIQAAAADDFSIRGVAMALGINHEALTRWFEENPELKQAFDFGREQERHVLHNKLYRVATEGTGKDAIIAAMFLLKSRHGYREGEQEQQSSRVHIELKLPAALPPAQYAEVIDHG